jgi:cysteinyl-tRNA synthetase
VPYRRQLNFTFAGLQQAASSVERLRNFRLRLRTEKFPDGTSDAAARAARAIEEFDAALDDDLNTAEALAAVFNLVRDANTSMDQGAFRAGDVPALENALQHFDRVLAVLTDDDREKLASFQPEKRAGLSDADIEALIGERQQARARRDFKRSDEIRDQLQRQGIILEDTKDGVRWKRA